MRIAANITQTYLKPLRIATNWTKYFVKFFNIKKIWGKKDNKIIFVGEAPGAEEDEKGIPFCGRGGKLLRNTIKQVGIEENEVYITNLVKCRPPNNRRPTKNEINSCNNYLKEEIRIIKPDITVLLGKTAIKKQYEDVKLKDKHGIIC